MQVQGPLAQHQSSIEDTPGSVYMHVWITESTATQPSAGYFHELVTGSLYCVRAATFQDDEGPLAAEPALTLS